MKTLLSPLRILHLLLKKFIENYLLLEESLLNVAY
nr:MAG TPA: hypothetical protein [Caudoviricetes sp.]